MSYLVVSYPKLADKDFEFIQNYRKIHDIRYFNLIKPHITLVFAIHDISEDSFVSEVEKQINDFPIFSFEMKVATINQDDSGEYYHEFLVPDTGYSNIVKLHDKLYSGRFSKYLRFDIDFIPHVGIGNSDKASTSKSRIDELNKNGINILSTVENIDVIEYKDGIIKTVRTFDLA